MKAVRYAALSLALLLILGTFPAALAEEPAPPEERGILEKAPTPEETPEPGDAAGPGNAAGPEDAAEPEVAAGPEDTAGPEEIPEPGQAAAPEAEEAAAPPDPEVSGVFQNGAFSGPQTIPGEPMTASLGWEEDAYNLLLDAWLQRKTEVSVLSLRIPWGDIDAFWEIAFKVLNDHPELFYADWYGTAYSSGGFISRQEFEYRSFPDVDQAIEDFDAAANEALAEIEGVTEELEKALILHDWLVTRCAYNWEVATGKKEEEKKDPNSYISSGLPWTAYGSLVRKDATCQGYTLAYEYLLSRAGIESVYLGSDSMNHAWNAVRIGGQWYHVDVTWDDPVPNKEGRAYHDYFLLSDETVRSRDHHGWDEVPFSCGSKLYEEGWVFNGLSAPLYHSGGSFFYMGRSAQSFSPDGQASWELNLNTVFKTESLREPGVPLPGGLGRSQDCLVWLEDRVYFLAGRALDTDRRDCALFVYDLSSGLIAQAGRFLYTPSPSPDGVYQAYLDQTLGLRYNAGTGEIEAVSATRRETLASFPARSLSAGWKNAQELLTAPELSADGAAAVFYPNTQELTLWAAFFQDGRFVSVRPAVVPERIDPSDFYVLPALTLAYPDMEGLQSYDGMRLMLLAEGLLPVRGGGANEETGGETGGGTDAPVGGGPNLPEDGPGALQPAA